MMKLSPQMTRSKCTLISFFFCQYRPVNLWSRNYATTRNVANNFCLNKLTYNLIKLLCITRKCLVKMSINTKLLSKRPNSMGLQNPDYILRYLSKLSTCYHTIHVAERRNVRIWLSTLGLRAIVKRALI